VPEVPRSQPRRSRDHERAGAGSGWNVTVDRELCLGSGMCIVYAPGTFAHDDQAKAVVVDPATDPLDTVRTAVEACPTRALQLVTGGAGA
jgi:ferredoxin